MSEQCPRVNEVQAATIEDLQALFDLLDVANQLSLEKSGKPGWQNIEAAHEDIRKRLDAGDVFVIRNQDGEISATITLGETNAEWAPQHTIIKHYTSPNT